MAKFRGKVPAAYSQAEVELALCTDIARLQHDPEGFLWFAFPWGEPGPLKDQTPRPWLLDVCRQIRQKLETNAAMPVDRWRAVQEACASGHGIGKSAGMAQLVLWALSTFEKTRGVVTANTDTQLRTKTWPELVKWHGLMINRHWFTMTATAIYHRLHEREWRVDAIPWNAHNTEAFAGLQNLGRRLFIGFDEASAIADPVWETTEGATMGAGTEILWFAFGNPTRSSGRFRECFTKHRELWGSRNVDSRIVPGANLDRIERWRRLYGEDSQFFNVRVRGQFVEADAHQLINLQWISEARMRGAAKPRSTHNTRLRISIDVADGGEDDTVLTAAHHDESRVYVNRQVRANYKPAVAPIEAAEAAQRMWDGWHGSSANGDDIVVDSLGVGAGCAGHLMKSGLPVVRYVGGEASANPKRFRNRRVQSYIAMRDAFRDGLIDLAPDMLPDDESWTEFEAQVCSVKSKPGTDRLEDIVTREEMRRDGVDSPDHADSLAMQFATQVPTIIMSGTEAILPQVIPSTILDGYVGGDAY